MSETTIIRVVDLLAKHELIAQRIHKLWAENKRRNRWSLGLFNLQLRTSPYLKPLFRSLAHDTAAMTLGDKTVASVLLAGSTVLLPLTVVIAHWKIVQGKDRTASSTWHGMASVAVVCGALLF